MATIQELLSERATGSRKKGVDLSAIYGTRRSAASDDPLTEDMAANEKMRTRLEGAGIADPTVKKPTALERLFGILDTPGTLVRAGVHNLISEDDVDVMGEVGKALKGENRIQGADLVDDLGVDNKWAQMGLGFVADVLLDPLTYLSFGTAGATKALAKGAVGEIAAKGVFSADDIARALNISDDAARAVVQSVGKDALDDAGRVVVSKLDKDTSRAFFDTLYKGMGDKGGVKVGLPFTSGVTVAPGSKGVTKALRAAGDRLGSTRAGEWFDKAFRYGNNADIYRLGNQVLNAGMDFSKRRVSNAVKIGEQVGAEFEQRLADKVADPRLRQHISVAIGRQFDNPEALGALRDTLGQVSDNLKTLSKLTDEDEGYEAAAEAVAASMDNLMELRAGILNPAAVEDYLRTVDGLSIEDIDLGKQVASDIEAQMTDLWREQRDAGVNVRALLGSVDDGETAMGAGYLPGMAPRDPKNPVNQQVLGELGVDPESLDAGKVGLGEVIGKMVPSTKQPKTFLTPEARLQGQTIEDFIGGATPTGKPIETELDIAILGGAATTKAQKNIAFKQFQDDLSNMLGGMDDPEMAAKARELASRTQELFTSDEAMKGALGTYDRILNSWKKAATIWNPRFPIRNFMSNKVLQGMEGMLDEASEREAIKVLAEIKSRGGLGAILSKPAEALDETDRLIRQAAEDGVLTNALDLSQQVGREALGAGNKTLKAVDDFAGGVNEMVENQSRLSVYLTAQKKGMGRSGAAQMVDRTLYSYDPNMLTAFERNVMKRIAPFYTWTRRNVPHMAELLATNPRSLAWTSHLTENAQAVNPTDDQITPDWLKDLMPVNTPLKDGRGNPIVVPLGGLLPTGDLDLIAKAFTNPKRIPQEVGSYISPLLKLPAELVMNRDLYSGNEITQGIGQKKRAPSYVQAFDRLAEAVPGLSDIWGAVKQSTGMEAKADPDSGDVALYMDPKAAKMLRDLNPWFNNVGKLLDENPRQAYDIFAWFTGIKATPFDTAQFTRQDTYADRRVLQDFTRNMRDRGALPSAEDEKAQDKARSARTKTLQELLEGRK